MVDLQVHSTYSDGSLTPTELVELARRKGIRALALTDHDTVEGIPEFLEAGQKRGVETVPGVEISVDAQLPAGGHLHVLGLFIDAHSGELAATLRFLRRHRQERAVKMVQKLAALGIPVSPADLPPASRSGAIGRPHVARLLVQKGIVSSLEEAFRKYLAEGRPAFVEKVKLDEVKAIRLIKQAGGLAVLAHPHLMNYPVPEEMAAKILYLKTLGLDGFEVYYPGMPPEWQEFLLQFAAKHDFVISGGSDFHGANKPEVDLGDLVVPDEVLEKLKTRWQQQQQALTRSASLK